MTRLRIVLCVVLIGASACAKAAGAGSPVLGDVILLDEGGSVKAIDAGSGEVKYSVPAAIASADYSKLYSADATTLKTVDSRSGEVTSSTAIPSGFSAGVVSGDSHFVALVPTTDAAPLGAMPAGKSSTQLVVADPSGTSKATTYRLDGNFEPEAFSTNDKLLFMLAYSPALSPERYQVTRLDLKTGAVSPSFGTVKGSAPKMQGTRVQHVLSPDRSALYTLYTNQDPSYSGAWGPGEAAFVHTLSLESGLAVCIDLPEEFGPGPSEAKTLVLSPDGSRLYAVDTDAALLSVIDTTKRKVIETKHIAFPSTEHLAAATTGPDGTLYVGAGTQVYVIDPQTLKVTDRWSVPEPINGLGSASGFIFATSADQVVTLDASTGREIGSAQSLGTKGLVFVSSSEQGSSA